MLSGSNKYLKHFLLKPLMVIGFLFLFSTAASAQMFVGNATPGYSGFNPLLKAAFKKPLKANALLAEHIKPSRYELMYWPNYPLTAAQIEARNREWERRNKQTIGEQLLSDISKDIIKNSVNSLIYGRKTASAKVPKF